MAVETSCVEERRAVGDSPVRCVLVHREIAGGLGDIGYTVPGQAWTYWHLGPGPGLTISTTTVATTMP
jgi:hypothetical protein